MGVATRLWSEGSSLESVSTQKFHSEPILPNHSKDTPFLRIVLQGRYSTARRWWRDMIHKNRSLAPCCSPVDVGEELPIRGVAAVTQATEGPKWIYCTLLDVVSERPISDAVLGRGCGHGTAFAPHSHPPRPRMDHAAHCSLASGGPYVCFGGDWRCVVRCGLHGRMLESCPPRQVVDSFARDG